MLFENNVVNGARRRNASGRIFQVTNGPIDTTIRHNTALITVSDGATSYSENELALANQFTTRLAPIRPVEGCEGGAKLT